MGTDISFCFIISPEKKSEKFSHSLLNKFVLICTPEYFSFGGGGEYIFINIVRGGAAIRLDGDLEKGYTYTSETFENKLLNGKEGEDNFVRCIAMEVYSLH